MKCEGIKLFQTGQNDKIVCFLPLRPLLGKGFLILSLPNACHKYSFNSILQTKENYGSLTVSPRTIFHSFKGTIGCRLFPRRLRGNRRGSTLLYPNGFQGMEGIAQCAEKFKMAPNRNWRGIGTTLNGVTSCLSLAYRFVT